MTLDEAIKHAEEVANTNERLCKTVHPSMQLSDYSKCAEEHRQLAEWLRELKQVREQITASEKCEYHTDHTDCIWYGNDSGCPATCSQYRDGWNDAIDYIFKHGNGYQPYRGVQNEHNSARK